MKYRTLLLTVLLLAGCRDPSADGTNASESPRIVYPQFLHSTPDEALQAVRNLSEIAKARGTPLRYTDVASILSPYANSSKRVVDMWTSAGIARSGFNLTNGAKVDIRLSESRSAPSAEWVIFEIIEELADKRMIIYDTNERRNGA